MGQENAIAAMAKVIYNICINYFKFYVMNKTLLLLFVITMSSTLNTRAEDITKESAPEIVAESVTFTQDGISLSKKEMKSLWKRLKKCSTDYEMNNMTLDLTTSQTIQLKQWLKKTGVRRQNWGYLFLLGGVGAIVGVALAVPSSENGKMPAWGYLAAIGGAAAMATPAAFCFMAGNARIRTSEYIIVAATPVHYELHFKNMVASAGIKVLSTHTKQFAIGPGITLSF